MDNYRQYGFKRYTTFIVVDTNNIKTTSTENPFSVI